MDHRKTKAILPRDLRALNEYLGLVGIGEYSVKHESGRYAVSGSGVFGDASTWCFNVFSQREIDGLTFADWIDLFRVLSHKDF